MPGLADRGGELCVSPAGAPVSWQVGDYALASNWAGQAGRVQLVHPPRAGTLVTGYWVRQLDPPYTTYFTCQPLRELAHEDRARLGLDVPL